MNALIAVLLILTLSAHAESYSAGPFQVSFDMGFPIDMEVQKPVSTETFAGKALTNYKLISPYMVIDIFDFGRYYRYPIDLLNNPQSLTTQEDRLIDGRLGKIAAGHNEGRVFYVAAWWIDNQTLANIGSEHPWDEGTLQLLKSINITR